MQNNPLADDAKLKAILAIDAKEGDLENTKKTFILPENKAYVSKYKQRADLMRQYRSYP